MERRHSRRVPAGEGQVIGRIVLAADLDVLDLSLTGVRFTCLKRIVPESSLTLVIRKGALHVSMKGTVVRSTLMAARSDARGEHPVFEVAVTFTSIRDQEKSELEKLIGLLGHQ